MTFHPDSLPDLTGRVYIVTGGNSGIGYHTCARLAQHGAHVYLCARSIPKGEAAIKSIQTLYPSARLSLLEIDHLSLSSVASAAQLFLKHEKSLHGLINNAGIMATPFALTPDGYEAQWQTNYLAHWVLTSHLLPLMLATSKRHPPGTVRIVNLSSSGHYSAPKGGIAFNDTALEPATPMTRYGQSKLGNILHIKTLHALYGPGSTSARAGHGEIWTAAVHPGLVESNLGEGAQLPGAVKWVVDVYAKFGGRIGGDRGSWTSVFCAAGNMKAENNGAYWQRIAEKGWQSGLAKDLDLARRLEEWTMKEMKKGGWVGYLI